MRKEFLTLESETIEQKERLMNAFKECIEFSGSRECNNGVLDVP